MDKSQTAVKNNPFGFGEANVAYAQYFQGQSFLNGLVPPQDNIDFNISNVSFEPGCRNHWHIHHHGYQILLVTAGEGWYQEAGQPAQLLHPGDCVVIKEGVKHWHGATADSWFAHLAITKGDSEWLEPVSDEDYAALDAKEEN